MYHHMRFTTPTVASKGMVYNKPERNVNNGINKKLFSKYSNMLSAVQCRRDWFVIQAVLSF